MTKQIFKILTSTSVYELEELVNEKLAEDGWYVAGPVFEWKNFTTSDYFVVPMLCIPLMWDEFESLDSEKAGAQ